MLGAWIMIKDTQTENWVLHWDAYFDGGNGVFMWTDGNYGCDCNRVHFFEAASEKVLEEDVECNATVGRFHVPYAFTATGEIFKIDAERT